MTADLSGVTVAVIGGDRRELELVLGLVACGAVVRAAGYPRCETLRGAQLFDSVEAAVEGAGVVIAPMTNTDAKGRILATLSPGCDLFLSAATLGKVPRGTPLLIGYAKPVIRTLAETLHLPLVELAELDHIAILNSIPTAEGALQLAMENLPITIHGSDCVVVGFGRCAITLARDLYFLGAKTSVVARNRAQLARAEEMGLTPVPWYQLDNTLRQADCVFNTVPAPVLSRRVLGEMRADTLIIDLASSPGGTDFAAAKELGINALHALGLPGKVAPKTAGSILAKHVPDLIADLLGHTGKGR